MAKYLFKQHTAEASWRRLTSFVFSHIVAVALFWFAGPATAMEGADDHAGPGLTANGNLSLAMVMEAFLDRYPQGRVASAHANRAAAESGYGSRWLPESMKLTAFHLTDRQLDDVGAYENEVAISFPLWLPGEKDAQNSLGNALTDSSASMERELRWRASASVRELLWQMTAARRQWELAVLQEKRLEELLFQVDILSKSGDLSRADQLAAVQELAAWKAETITLEAAYHDTERSYRALTGLDAVPGNLTEALSGVDEITDEHPALKLAIDRAGNARATADLVWQRSDSRPTVDIFWRGYRGGRTEPQIDSIGIGVSVPLGRPPRRNADTARANEELALAEAAMIELHRQLDLQLHEARHGLATTRLKLKNSGLMLDAASEKLSMDQLSYELGEISMSEWLRRLSGYKEIEQSHELLLIQEGAAIAAYNQAAGESL